MDDAEKVFLARSGEDLDEDDFQNFEEEFSDPQVQIETVRRQILSNVWSENITKEVSDWLEQSGHKENGKFNYKSPGAVVGVGRCKA